jgi:hypothetical protein
MSNIVLKYSQRLMRYFLEIPVSVWVQCIKNFKKEFPDVIKMIIFQLFTEYLSGFLSLNEIDRLLYVNWMRSRFKEKFKNWGKRRKILEFRKEFSNQALKIKYFKLKIRENAGIPNNNKKFRTKSAAGILTIPYTVVM